MEATIFLPLSFAATLLLKQPAAFLWARMRHNALPLPHNERVYFFRWIGCAMLSSICLAAGTRPQLSTVLRLDPSAGHLILPALATLFTAWMLGKTPSVNRRFPQAAYETWNVRRVALNSASWLAYLFAYEWFWRGVFLHRLLDSFDPPGAITINVLCYAASHLPASRREALAAIPFGIVLCLVSITSGGFVNAFVLHFILAVIIELSSWYHRETKHSQS